MEVAIALLWIMVAYLYGSLNYALIFTRLRTGEDIRTLGNRNAGAANVRRTVGFGWGVLVFFLDLSKSLVPMAGASISIGSGNALLRSVVLLSVGIAAFLGHCRPLYYGFRGGRGIATSIGIYAWFVPLELVAAMLIGAGLVLLLVREVEHRMGPYTPILIVTLTPFFALATALTLRPVEDAWPPLGAQPWYIVTEVFLLSLVILAVNLSFLRERFAELRTPRGGMQKFDQ